MDEELPEPGITGERVFRVEPRHTTNLFGEQEDPPGLPAATDAGDDEAIRVLGTPHLLAEVEFLGRESVRGHLPEGTGVVGVDAEVTHRRAVPIGGSVRVRTEVVDVTDRTITVEGELSRAADGDTDNDSLSADFDGDDAVVGEVTNRIRVVRRDAFADRIDL